MNILSLDVSAASTGWCVLQDTGIYFGVIKTNAKLQNTERLLTFKTELCKILKTYKPTNIVIEDIFVGLNASTIKVLAEFAGVAKLTCKEVVNIVPYIISTNTVKAYYKAKKKEMIFNFMLDILEQHWEYKHYNDIVDALAQVICYTDIVLNLKAFRFTEEYGYFYKIEDPLHNHLIRGV
ncbi:MAG TPA: crossover junction endodeoxyribonuclease RuvC [Patescibacteria group bacterium]|nr:crossover junction endodeoxyribonuclease RuvC [Patescibacteria group bacterium]